MLKIREIQERDLESLLTVINEPGIIEHMPLERPVQIERLQSWYGSFRRFGYPAIFVLELDEPIGACSIRENGKITVWVSARHHGKGYGKKAIEKLADYARENKIERLWLDCHHENKRALDFYHRIGFKDIGESKGSRVLEMRL